MAADTWNQTKVASLQEGIAGEVLRFHVRANSESDYDQQVKMQVKEEVIAYLHPVIASAKSVQEAKILLNGQLDEIQLAAGAVLKRENCDYTAEVFFREEDFPQKTYGDCTFPAGEYEALVIELGRGQGRNWWCMLYPGLCFIDETYAVVSEEKKEELEHVLTEEEYDWVTDSKKRVLSFRWKWLDDLVDKCCG